MKKKTLLVVMISKNFTIIAIIVAAFLGGTVSGSVLFADAVNVDFLYQRSDSCTLPSPDAGTTCDPTVSSELGSLDTEDKEPSSQYYRKWR